MTSMSGNKEEIRSPLPVILEASLKIKYKETDLTTLREILRDCKGVYDPIALPTLDKKFLYINFIYSGKMHPVIEIIIGDLMNVLKTVNVYKKVKVEEAILEPSERFAEYIEVGDKKQYKLLNEVFNENFFRSKIKYFEGRYKAPAFQLAGTMYIHEKFIRYLVAYDIIKNDKTLRLDDVTFNKVIKAIS
jgi:hypothetical protein